jgi:phosphohistidine phosphatase SixA
MYNTTYYLNKSAYLALLKKLEPKCRTILFASHNSRMRCFVESVIDKSVYENYRHVDAHPEEYRFKNCAILSIRVRRGCPNATLELVYSGHIEDENRQKGMYYVKEGDSSNSSHDRVFKTQQVPLKNLGLELSCIDGDYELLVIRHGEAEHNLKSYYNVPLSQTNENTIAAAIKDNKLDTDLTPDGRAETKKAAEFITTYLNERAMHKKVGLDYVFCSILKRTRQTLDIILENMKETGLINRINKMVVAPCSREIKYGDVRGCFVRDPEPAYFDDPANKADLRFNQPFCSFLTKDQSELPAECRKVSDYAIDPTHYIDYHKNSKCSGLSTNMAEVVIDVVKKLDCKE